MNPMSGFATLLVPAAFAAAALLIRPAVRRTGLMLWHPAVLWLILMAVFFGIGSAMLSLDGRAGPALYTSGATLVFAAAVAASDRLARRRSNQGPVAPADAPPDPVEPIDAIDAAPLRPTIVVALAVLGLVLIAPTLLRVGLPFLAGDITGARSALAGLSLQVLRVTVPALALALVLRRDDAATTTGTPRRRRLAWLAVGLLVAMEIVLASRYLAAELVAIVLVGVGLSGRQLPLRRLAALAIVAVVAFGGVQVLRAYDQAAGRELAFAFERTVNRVVLIQPRTLEALQVAIPAEQPYFGGLTWLRRLGPALGRPDVPNLGYWVYPRLFPGQEPPGYAAPGVIGEAWANFGPAGLALFAILGLVAERLGAFVSRRRRMTGDLVAGALLIVFLARTHALGLNGLAVLVAIVVGWRALAAGGLADTWWTLRDVLAWRA